MRFSLANGKLNDIKAVRESYVKQYKVKEVEITPCEKFVACLCKLTRNYVLALRDTATIETLQIVNQNDLEFFEGYEITGNYTDSVRLNICKKVRKAYLLIVSIINNIRNKKYISHDNNYILYDNIEQLTVIKNILLNIFQYLTMTNIIPDEQFEITENINNNILQLIDELSDIRASVIISHIEKIITEIIDKLMIMIK